MKDAIRIYKLLIKYWGLLLLNIFFMVCYAFFSGVSITMVSPLLDFVFAGDPEQISITSYSEFWHQASDVVIDFFQTADKIQFNKEAFSPLLTNFQLLLEKTDPLLLLWMISTGFVILIIIKNIFYFLNRVTTTSLKGLTVRDLRNVVFHKYLFLSLAFFNKNKIGDSLVRMVSDIQIICNQYIGALFNMVRNLLLIGIFVQIAVFINAKLFLISMIMLPIFGYLISQLGKKLKKYAKRKQGQYSTMFSYMEEILSSIRIVKAFSQEKNEMDKYKKVNQRYYKFWRKTNIYSALNVPISEISSVLTGAILLIIGGKFVLADSSSFTVGNFMAFLFAFFSMLHPLKELTTAYANIRKANVSLGRVTEILNTENDIKTIKNPLSISKFKKEIKFINVEFSYEVGKQILRDINLTVKKGEKIALVGSSGSGKTTLVNLVNRMYDPASGSILIDDIPIDQLKLEDLRRLFGVVTQESILFSVSVQENIGYGSIDKISNSDIKKAANIAFADEFIEQLPNQYDTILEPKASNLSGGQKQRLCIARAIANDPPILIFDEATSALDSEAEQKVQKAIERSTRNKTVFLIAHRLSTVLNADKIVVMDQGNIIDVGTHEDLLQRCERYKLLYKIQFKN